MPGAGLRPAACSTWTPVTCRPPAYTALRAVTLPARGGETLFTNQYRAYETLPAEVHATLAGRTIRHVVTGLDLGGVASYYDALAKPRLEPYCEVLHGDADMIAALDDKTRSPPWPRPWG